MTTCEYNLRCTKGATCQTNDWKNCPVYQEFDLHRSLYPKFEVRSFYERSMDLIRRTEREKDSSSSKE